MGTLRCAKRNEVVSYKDHRIEIAAQILSGFAANPSIFQPNERSGWALINCSDTDLAAYAVRLADELIAANDGIAPQNASNASKDDHG